MNAIALFVIAVLAFTTTAGQVSTLASTRYQAFESISQTVDDKNKVTSEKIYIKLDSSDPNANPTVQTDKTNTNDIGGGGDGTGDGQQRATRRTKIWASRVRPDKVKIRIPSSTWAHKNNLAGGTDYLDADLSLNSIGGHQMFAPIRARTVESPALSVDSGRGRSNHPSVRIADGIKRLFNVEEGHYSDIYDRIDKHKPLTKKKPAQAIDERLG